MMESRQCEYCGKEFQPAKYNAKYCSRKCKDRMYYVRKKIAQCEEPPLLEVRKCEYCGKEFETTISWKKYCSSDCKYLALLERRWRPIPPPAYCEYCGKEFQPVRKNTRYCSKKCNEADLRRKKKAEKISCPKVNLLDKSKP